MEVWGTPKMMQRSSGTGGSTAVHPSRWSNFPQNLALKLIIRPLWLFAYPNLKGKDFLQTFQHDKHSHHLFGVLAARFRRAGIKTDAKLEREIFAVKKMSRIPVFWDKSYQKVTKVQKSCDEKLFALSLSHPN